MQLAIRLVLHEQSLLQLSLTFVPQPSRALPGTKDFAMLSASFGI